MKFFTGAILLALSANVFASESAIYDLQYLPKAGTFYGITDVGLANGGSSGSDVDIDLSGYAINQVVAYSFTDRLTLGVELSWLNLKQEIDYSTNVNNAGFDDKDFKTSGLADPAFAGRFRLIDEAYRFDLLARLSVSIGDKEVDGDDIDAGNGGNSFALGGELGQKAENFQWSVGAGISRDFESTTDTKGQGEVENDAHNTWLFSGELLNKIAERSFVRSFAQVSFEDEYDDDQDPEETTSGKTEYDLGAEYRHLCTKDLMAKVGLAYSQINNYILGEDYSFWTFSVGANYQF